MPSRATSSISSRPPARTTRGTSRCVDTGRRGDHRTLPGDRRTRRPQLRDTPRRRPLRRSRPRPPARRLDRHRRRRVVNSPRSASSGSPHPRSDAQHPAAEHRPVQYSAERSAGDRCSASPGSTSPTGPASTGRLVAGHQHTARRMDRRRGDRTAHRRLSRDPAAGCRRDRLRLRDPQRLVGSEVGARRLGNDSRW